MLSATSLITIESKIGLNMHPLPQTNRKIKNSVLAVASTVIERQRKTKVDRAREREPEGETEIETEIERETETETEAKRQ